MRGAGAPGRRPPALALAIVAVLAASPHAALAQDPPVADSAAVPDTVRLLPEFTSPVPASFATGIREWGAENLLNARGITLLELLEEVPGIVPLRGGDYGQPESASAFAGSAGRIRVFVDGIELPPLDGGTVDLSRIGLGGIERVRVERRPGELRIELFALVQEDPRPRTLVEFGTGDLNTNLFRGTFVHPTFFGGTFSATLDRVDTAGPFGGEPGSSAGVHFRYARAFGERFGATAEIRRRTARRDDDLWDPPEATRSDLTFEGRVRLTPGILGAVYLRRSSLSLPNGGATEAFEEGVQTRAGFRVALEGGSVRAEATAHLGWGRGVPWDGERLLVAAEEPGWGGASVSVERENWEGEAHWNLHARLRTAPLAGVVLFAEAEDGRRPVPAPWAAGSSLLGSDERTGLRAGAEWSRGGFSLGAAALRISADSLRPTGLPFDRGGLVLAGGDRTGMEAIATIPLEPVLEGLRLEGVGQFWDGSTAWSFLPRSSYRAELAYHDVFRPSGNLEVWARVGAEGRDAMLVPFEGGGGTPIVAAVPFRQSWFAFLEVRVVSARIFVRWENLTLRRGNQDFPGRVLPATRAIYGVRWTLWN